MYDARCPLATLATSNGFVVALNTMAFAQTPCRVLRYVRFTPVFLADMVTLAIGGANHGAFHFTALLIVPDGGSVGVVPELLHRRHELLHVSRRGCGTTRGNAREPSVTKRGMMYGSTAGVG